MSRQSKNARNLAKAKVITAMHLRGEKGPARTGTSAKKKAWWQLGSYSSFVKGGKKAKPGAEAA
jgi:hypothetical protein